MTSEEHKKLNQGLTRYYEGLNITPSSGLDDRILSQGLTAMKQAHGAKFSRKRRLIRIAAVVLMCLAIGALWFPERHGLMSETVAFADVQKTLLTQDTVRVQGTRVCTFTDPKTLQPVTLHLRFEKVTSPQGHMDRAFDANDTLILQVSTHYPTQTVTVLLAQRNQCYRFPMLETTARRLQSLTLEGKLEILFFGEEYRSIESRKIQGIEALGFETQNVGQSLTKGLGLTFLPMLMAVDQGKVQLWVDPNTHLPMWVNAEIDLSPCLLTGMRSMRLVECANQFEWGDPVDENDLRPDIPKHFQIMEIPSRLTEEDKSNE